jgi:hypothetical protein
VVCAALLTAGCLNRRDVAPGDVFTVEETFEFYFRAGQSKYVNFPPELAQYLLDDASWQVPDGVSLEKKDVQVSPTLVMWTTGNYRYTAHGFKLRVSCVVRVAQDVRPGDRELLLSLPGLTRTGSILKAEPSFLTSRGQSAWAGSLNVKAFAVHGTAAAKSFFAGGRFVLGVVLLLAVLALLVAAACAHD